MDHLKGAVGIDGKHGLPLLIGHLCQRAIGEDAGIGTDDIEPAVLRNDLAVHVFDRSAVGYIHTHGAGA